MRCLNCGKARTVLSTYKNSTPSDEEDIEGASGMSSNIVLLLWLIDGDPPPRRKTAEKGCLEIVLETTTSPKTNKTQFLACLLSNINFRFTGVTDISKLVAFQNNHVERLVLSAKIRLLF